MKKVWMVLLCLILLNSCSSSPTQSSIPINTASPFPTFTPKPIPIITSTPVPFLHVVKSTLITLNAMTGVSSSDGTLGVWFVGNDGFIAHRSPLGYTLRIDSPEQEHLNDIDFVSPDDGWIVGAGGLIMHWNGTQWKISKPSISSSGAHYFYNLSRVVFTQANDGWAAGDVNSEGGCQFLIDHWDGTTWTEISLPQDWYQLGCVHDMVALSSTDVWIVGTNWNQETERGVTIHWDGHEWKMFSELNSYNIYSISALSPDNIWAITQNGVVLNWNGVAWKESTRLDSANVIFAQDPDNIFAVGTKIWYWNGGNWADISLSSNFPSDADIKSILAPYKAESGYLDIWMLDSSGIVYTFAHPRTIVR